MLEFIQYLQIYRDQIAIVLKYLYSLKFSKCPNLQYALIIILKYVLFLLHMLQTVTDILLQILIILTTCKATIQHISGACLFIYFF